MIKAETNWDWKWSEEQANDLRKEGHYVAVVGPPPDEEPRYDEETDTEPDEGGFLVVWSDEPIVVITRRMARAHGMRNL